MGSNWDRDEMSCCASTDLSQQWVVVGVHMVGNITTLYGEKKIGEEDQFT